jgi:glycosyltransferase involved in cell wall biosynthesis
MKTDTIFIQIAAYRDPQLVPTVLDCIANATYPDRLKFCIAWQHSADEQINAIKYLPNVEILDIPYLESKGACWARNKIQQQYRGETYTLQLDSHHRFVKGWDTELEAMSDQLKKTGVLKPVLTTYGSSFNPQNDPAERGKLPYKLTFDRFIPEGAVFFLPATINNCAKLTAPQPARFYSGHFCFAPGSFAVDVQHDPNYYFHGEEISIAVRAYTHGYDLFHPHKLILWHEFTRAGRPKHWDDHNEVPVPWSARNDSSHARNRCLFSMDGADYNSIDWGPYGLGTVRTLQQYERYAGLNFSLRSIQQETLDGRLPPNTTIVDEAQWKESFLRIFKHCLDVHESDVPLTDYDFWAVSFEKADGTVVNRKDLSKDEILRLKKNYGFFNVWREFMCKEQPKRWVVWPHSASKGWCNRITKDI